MHLDDLVEQFCAATLPHAEWTHTAHLRVGAWHVYHFGAGGALDRLRCGIRRLNESHGTPNSETRGYHETITVAYVRLIDAFLAEAGAQTPLQDRVALLLASPLADRRVLTTFWTPELLLSPRARAEWVEPNAAPLELARIGGGPILNLE